MRPEFETIEKLQRHLSQASDLRRGVFWGIDLTSLVDSLLAADLQNAVLLGCVIPDVLQPKLQQASAIIFPNVPDKPFAEYRGLLYTPEELLGDYRIGDHDSYYETLDGKIYQHYTATGRYPDDAIEALTRRLHDMAITDALREFIQGRTIVAIMGGHSMLRDDPMFFEAALLARTLTLKGYLVATGGGPGAMEAAHLGAWFATRRESDLADAVSMLADAPLYDPIGPWMDAACEVAKIYPVENRKACQSLGIPTWLYGHEPPARFALTIAKYFANSVREEGLLGIANGGVIFAPGSAGTIQEVFQDACQNHYKTFGDACPMVFVGTDFWTKTTPVYPLLKNLAAGQAYEELLSIHDDRSSIVAAIDAFNSRPSKS